MRKDYCRRSHRISESVAPGMRAGTLALIAGTLIAACAAAFTPRECRAGDWPQWGYDAARTASSDEELPEKLELEWLLELPEPRPAWPADQEDLQFDRLYEPVLHGKNLFVPSMLSDKVTAYDADTGKEVWTFYTEGPVRFAPAAWEGKVYFVSDDSYLYCVDALKGSLHWKFRGGPSDRLILGQDRLVSTWPARGAPVVYDGKVYFGASIWPFAGIFLHALDARTGAVVWTQSGVGSSYIQQQHSSDAFAGVAPQGYIAATADRLVVSGGRTVPAVFDRHTGDLIHFIPGNKDMGSKGGGGYDVAVGKDFILNRKEMYRLDDGKFIAAVDAPVLTEHSMIGAHKDGVRGFRPGWREEESKDRRGNSSKKLVVGESWSAILEKKISRVFVKGGSRLYCSGEKGLVLAVDLPRFDRGAGISWSVEIPDTPLNMIVGGGKLFVSTDKGRIYAFGGRATGAKLPVAEAVTLVPRGSVWRYLDDGSHAGTAWRTLEFDDQKWATGPAKLGYGDDNEATKVSFGPDAKDKHVTTYFRRVFEAPAAFDYSNLKLSVLVDDGAVLYLNGEEVGRLFMPTGEVTPATLASVGTDENKYNEVRVPHARLLPGKNVIAVEVHQATRDSSDLCLDLELSGTKTPPRPRLDLPRDDWTHSAGALLRTAGVKDGYCVVLGLGTGQLAEEVAKQSKLHVVVIDPDAARIDLFRRRLDGLGIYGTRIAARVGNPLETDLPAYMADLILSEAPGAAGIFEGPASVARIFRVLRPHSGKACFLASAAEFRDFRGAVEAARLDGARLERHGSFALLQRPSAPTGAANWTHQYGDAANTVSSMDTLVKAPLQLLWFGGPSNAEILPRHGHGPAPQVVDGRLFIEGRDLLRAADIYTGRLLWERRLKDLGQFYDYSAHEPGANAIGSNYVSVPDGVYVIHGKRCLRLDNATGETITEFRLPRDVEKYDQPDWGYLGISKHVLVAGAEPARISAPVYTESTLGVIKDDALRRALRWIPTWTGFEPIARVKDQSDHSYLNANLNKLLADDDLVARIPAEVRERAQAKGIERELKEYFDEVRGARGWDHEALVIKRRLLHEYYDLPKLETPTPGKFGGYLSVGSQRLVGMDRYSGTVLWHHDAKNEFRHNTIAIGGGQVFCMDRVPSARESLLRRRGFSTDEEARIIALDLEKGDVVWSGPAQAKGTWLSFSEEHDVLLEAGSAGRDRLPDELAQGMAAYRGSTGELLWKNEEKYNGPCILLGEALITQGSGTPGFSLDLLDGKRKMRPHPITGHEAEWQYTRNYGCNTVVACPGMLTFRSAAAGYFDLEDNVGTGNIGGFRSGCTSNLIPAGGILNAPDYTRDCTCSYQNQVSLALIHDPGAEMWTFSHMEQRADPVKHLGLNLGAPGDRRGPDGALWLDAPNVGGSSPWQAVEVLAEGARYPRVHESYINSGPLPWVVASALEGEGEVAVRLITPASVLVRNEMAGRSPLRVSGATVSANVPLLTLPGGVSNTSSIEKGPVEGEMSGIAEAVEGLAAGSITVELWVRTDKDLHYVDARAASKAGQGFVIDQKAVRVRYFVTHADKERHCDEVKIEAKDKIADNTWTHVAFTYDAEKGLGTLHVGGKVVASHDGPDRQPLWWDGPLPDLALGKDWSAATRLDELRIASRALEAREFLISKEAPAAVDGVVSHWRMDAPEPELEETAGEGTTGSSIRFPEPGTYTVRLFFAEIEGLGPGERVFDVGLQGRACLQDFDIAKEAGGPFRSIMKEIDDVEVRDHLRVRLTAKSGRKPLLNGIQVIVKSRTF